MKSDKNVVSNTVSVLLAILILINNNYVNIKQQQNNKKVGHNANWSIRGHSKAQYFFSFANYCQELTCLYPHVTHTHT